MLPHKERKDIAEQNGFKTIGAFEEEVILSRALHADDDANEMSMQSTAVRNNSNDAMYKNEDLYELEKRPERYGLPMVAKRAGKNNIEDSKLPAKDGEESVSSSEDDDILLDVENEEDDRDVNEGGLMVMLPDELILHNIFSYISTEQFAVCALVSPHWKSFTRSELAYKELCKRCYLKQSKRKALHVARFGSYRNMLEQRFRVKTGAGLYILKTSKIKKVQRDMWTEIPLGAILETTYYRYLDFYEDGKVLYALTPRPPHEMIPAFKKVKAGLPTHIQTVFGTYEIQKDIVTVKVEHPWHHVRMFLKILENGAEGAVGRFWALKFEKHQSSISNDFDEYWSRDLVEYDVPVQPFRFLRHWRL